MVYRNTIKLFRMNRDLKAKEKNIYFYLYMKHKNKCKKWHTSNKKYRQIILYKSNRNLVKDDIWKDILHDQTYEPITSSKLRNSIW